MGYTIKVGNAVPEFSKDDLPYLYAKWRVDNASNPNAPTFPNDEMTGDGNQRHPSYSVWLDFAKTVGLRDFFFDDRDNLHVGHPGCMGLTLADADRISAALSAYQAKATLPPGFEGLSVSGDAVKIANYDSHLARLIWLDWWVRWAVENCETPAIQNT